MAKKILTTLDFGGLGGIVGLPTSTDPNAPATVAQVNALLEGLAWKDEVRTAANTNVTVATPGASIGGVALTSGDGVLLMGQTAGAQNGIYTWNGAAVPLTRRADASVFAELASAVVTVNEGTFAGNTYRQTVPTGTIDTTTNTWSPFGVVAPPASETIAGVIEIATQAETDAGTDNTRAVTPLKLANYAGLVKRFSATFGDGSASTYVITHNLNSQDVVTQVREVAAPYSEVICDVEATSVNSVTLRFSGAVALNSLRAKVLA